MPKRGRRRSFARRRRSRAIEAEKSQGAASRLLRRRVVRAARPRETVFGGGACGTSPRTIRTPVKNRISALAPARRTKRACFARGRNRTSSPIGPPPAGRTASALTRGCVRGSRRLVKDASTLPRLGAKLSALSQKPQAKAKPCCIRVTDRARLRAQMARSRKLRPRRSSTSTIQRSASNAISRLSLCSSAAVSIQSSLCSLANSRAS